MSDLLRIREETLISMANEFKSLRAENDALKLERRGNDATMKNYAADIVKLRAENERLKEEKERAFCHMDEAINTAMFLKAENERLKEYEEHCLRQLLAIIHRDGGHYLTEHGVKKATEDAIVKSHEMLSQIEKSSLAVAWIEKHSKTILADYTDGCELVCDLESLLGAINETGKGQSDREWLCLRCGLTVQPKEVCFDETHDGCGGECQ